MTARLTAIDPARTTGKTKALLDGVQRKLGLTPNLFRTLANSPAVLEGYLAFSDELEAGSLNAKLREQIALAVAEANSCEYCLSAHTLIGKLVGLSEHDIAASRGASANDQKTEAALIFAHQIVVTWADITDTDVARVREAGYADGEIAEIVANVAINIFTKHQPLDVMPAHGANDGIFRCLGEAVVHALANAAHLAEKSERW